jgi:hypothetical protein
VMAKDALPVPSEEWECDRLMEWADRNMGRWPVLALLYHTANEGKRSPQAGARLKKMGLKPGVSDYFFPVARGGCHGLWIEMKRTKGGHVTPAQADWIDNMLRQGYAACVCRGWEEASREIERYLRGGTTGDD